ncbi:transposase domain-containing protein, partial [Blautia sp. HCN-1074]|uniref:transposase domain-containing protein n=1 Tax=Blautia sp. HCN-1074 TaxID=3134667 RepID=UPI0030BA316A
VTVTDSRLASNAVISSLFDGASTHRTIYPLLDARSDPPYPPLVLIESSNGAKASAILYSLVETAKANTINTFEYFNLLLTEIPQHMEDKDLSFIDDLLPWSSRVQKECPSKYKKS